MDARTAMAAFQLSVRSEVYGSLGMRRRHLRYTVTTDLRLRVVSVKVVIFDNMHVTMW